MTIGEKIAILRKARGFSQEQLGLNLETEGLGVSRQSVCDWENNRTEPKLENIKALAKLLDVSFDALLDDSLDLSDPKTLSAVISKYHSGDNKNKTGYSIHYTIYEYQSFFKRFAKDIISISVLLIVTVIGLVMFSMDSTFKTALGIIGLIALMLSGGVLLSISIMFIINLKDWIQSKDGRDIARLDYKDLTIYPNKNDYSNRAIFLPVSKITKIQKLADDVLHCDVEIIIEENEQTRRYVLSNVNNPDRLITVFNGAKEFLNNIKKEEEN